MTNKWLMVLAIAGLSLAGAKSYDVAIPSVTVVHNLRLKPGDYHIKLQGSNVIFTNAYGDSFKTTATVQTASTKAEYTEVETKKIAGQDQVEEILLGGSRTKLEFN